MIKKTTTVKLVGDNEMVYELPGGMPLGVGEQVQLTFEGEENAYVVSDKQIHYRIEGEEHHVHVVYTIKSA